MPQKIIEELLKQRQGITDKIMMLQGKSWSATRDALLENLRSLDEVIKIWKESNPTKS